MGSEMCIRDRGQRASQIVDKARSRITGVNPEDKHAHVKIIVAMNRSIKKINNLQGNIVPERRRFESLNVNKSQLRTSVTNSDHTSREMKVDLVEKTMDTRR